jgi:hypothetical protein
LKLHKLIFLFPAENFVIGYKYYPNHNDHESEFHQCKIAMVKVISDGVLSEDLAEDILRLVD